MPQAILPCDYPNQTEICAVPGDPNTCVYKIDNFYYAKVEYHYDVGGVPAVYCALYHLPGVTA
jgi:hypothetical protein